MPRYIITDPFPRPSVVSSTDVIIVAPHSGVGKALGAPVRSLNSIAKAALRKNGIGIATPVKAANSLMAAVREISGSYDSASVARHLREMVGAMLRSGIDTQKVANLGSAHARQAAEVAARYRDILAKEHLVDSDAVLASALEFNFVEKQKVVVYGYFRARQFAARPEEFEFIDRLADDESIFYLPLFDSSLFSVNQQWADWFSSRGWFLKQARAAAPRQNGENVAARFAGPTTAPICNVAANEYPDIESEVRGTLARAKACALSGCKTSSIAIVCRDLHLYAKSLISVAREYCIPIDIDCDVPIGQTEFGEFVSLLMDVFERRPTDEIDLNKASDKRGFQYEATLRLMLHRFGPGQDTKKRDLAFRTRPDTFEAWQQIAPELEMLAINGPLEPLNWIGRVKKILFDWNLRGADKLGPSAAGIRAFETFFESLEQLAFERGSEPILLNDLASDVEDVLANIKTALHTEAGGLKVILPNVAVGSAYERMFVIGMAEGILPAPSKDNSVVDFFEREMLRKNGIEFENALEVPRWEALTFYFTLLASSGPIDLSFPRFANDKEQIESSYFKRLGLVPLSPTGRYISSSQEARRQYIEAPVKLDDPVMVFAKHQFDVEKYRESDAPPDKYDGVIGMPIRRNSWSASSLAKIGSCPFKWFVSDVLMLREPEEADTDLPPNVRGTLLHKALEIASGKSLGTSGARTAILESLEEAFVEAETLHTSLSLITNWRLRRTEQLKKLERAITSDEFIDEGSMIVATEKEFVVEFAGMKIKGWLDRIDKCADGRLLAVDYKHGSYLGKVKDENGQLSVEIQLPIYSTIALPALFPDEPVAGGRFFHISDAKVTKGKDIDLENFLSRIKQLLEQGRFAVDPDLKRDACTYCDYPAVCRVGNRVELKRERL